MSPKYPRMAREKRTVEAMIGLYCQGMHGPGGGLCAECEALVDYAVQRLSRCPFQEGKATCAKCPVHCYRPVMRDRIRAVMRYSGPRMLTRHPIMTVQHMVDGLRRAPLKTQRPQAAGAIRVKKSRP